ncbi:uncharacterized protein UV8b_04133 [Ustilaginoidea virens]|uniref:Uncharacterized protein n=1 Tax=Ustilaginoidea virens TaxID=1159556 RepID=A0A063CAX8_USTVR|nr:uncharacterized protein UV8b_04133 [Ustilaginoidea virens]QUC19892.1 hypothetical protein UV8b_04133 [Ustilaginoidea virens]GAO20003.1 hypothetical protein UVI_02006130 [Ustilaginoidea virens]
MTKLSSDSFLPSGAIDIPTNGPIGGFASHSGLDTFRPKPSMALSGGATSLCSQVPVRQAAPDSRTAHDTSIQSPSTNNSDTGDSAHHDFPLRQSLLHAPSTVYLPDSLSLPTCACAVGFKASSGRYFHPNAPSPSPPASWDIGGASLARSVSADAVVSRGIGGRSSLAESSIFQRTNLDALRRRAEELCRDQQAVIDDMSQEWLREKTDMSRLVRGLHQRIQRLEGENAVLRAIASHSAPVPGLSSFHSCFQSHGGGGGRSWNKSSPPQRTLGRGASGNSAAMSLPPGLDGASRRPHFAKRTGSPSTSPLAAPTADHPVLSMLLSPRTEPQQSACADFLLPSPPDTNGDVPVIDIQEIDPKLEGVPLKINAVRKPTFEPRATTDRNPKLATSPRSKPPGTNYGADQARRKSDVLSRDRVRGDRRRSGLTPLAISKSQEQTKHILATDESRRLTMHAGHTPNHSLSLFPTMTATGSGSAAARSQEDTPVAAWPSNNPAEERAYTPDGHDANGETRLSESLKNLPDGHNPDGGHDRGTEAYLEPADDVALKGPLMIKNIPAQDEIFWAQVNQRLDPISRGKGALPKVLQSPEAAVSQSMLDANSPRAANGPDPEDASPDSDGGKPAVEPDVPLKFKSTCNFGAPFGST